MVRFVYRALGPSGKIKSGDLEAISVGAAALELRRSGLTPVSLRQASPISRLLGWMQSDIHPSGSLKLKDQVVFATTLANLLGAGLNALQSVEIVADSASERQIRRMAKTIAGNIRVGSSLSASIDAAGGRLDPIFMGLIEAGQESGKLADCLAAAAHALSQKEANRRKLRNALAYPIVLCAGMMFALYILLAEAVPRLQPLFENSQADPPLLTVILFAVSETVTIGAPFFGAFLLGLVLVVSVVWRTDRFQLALERAMLGTPLLRGLVRRSEVALFCRMLAIFLEAAFLTSSALEKCGSSLSTRTYRRFCLNAAHRIREGDTFAKVIGSNGVLIPRNIATIVAIGDQSGQLPALLYRSADILENELESLRTLILSLMTPVILVVLGSVVLMLIVSVWTTVLSLNDAIL